MERDGGAAEGAAAAGPAAEAAQPLEALPQLRVGTLVEGTVAAVATDHVLLDVHGKADGVLPLAEAVLPEGAALTEVFTLGQTVLVSVIGFEAEDGAPRLSQRRAATSAAWRRVEEAFRAGTPVEGPVREVVKGGLVLDLGVRGFMPASQVARGQAPELAPFVGQTLSARILECDRTRNKVILSRRALLEEEHRRQRAELWAELAEGQVRSGVVKALADFGAFIDLGGVDGLLHVSAMSWGRVERPADLLSVGQRLQVKILHLDREHEKVSLGLKQVAPDPWATAAERYQVGAVVPGRVMRLCAFGAFVQLEPGIDGLVHISQLADQHVRDAREVVAEGQAVAVKILKVAPADRRISLSLREAAQEPPARARETAPPTAGRSDPVTLGEVLGDLGALLHDPAPPAPQGPGPA